jgi:acylphosphatase
MAVRRVRVIVRGVVQGVGFRYHTREQGTALGLQGFVRNAPDGSVEVEAEGNPDTIEQLITWLRTGPRHAVVSSIDVDELAPTGNERSFEISR